MIIKSLNPREIEKSEALPSWVKESAKASVCFFIKHEMITHFIEVDNSNSQDMKDATDEFNKMIRENPDKPIYMISRNHCFVHNFNQPTYQFPPTHWSENFAKEALEKLKEKHLVEGDLQEDIWLYIFGYAPLNPQSTVKIKWLGTKENLSQFLDLWYDEEYRRKMIKRITYRSLVPFSFIYKGYPMHLAKPQKEKSLISDFIENIFRPNENN